MSKYLEALAYFLSNGLDFKLAKELAESVTGSKVTDEKTLEAFTPELKKSTPIKFPKNNSVFEYASPVQIKENDILYNFLEAAWI